MKKILLSLVLMVSVIAIQAKTLVVYCSYTNNVHDIVTELTGQIDADVEQHGRSVADVSFP